MNWINPSNASDSAKWINLGLVEMTVANEDGTGRLFFASGAVVSMDPADFQAVLAAVNPPVAEPASTPHTASGMQPWGDKRDREDFDARR